MKHLIYLLLFIVFSCNHEPSNSAANAAQTNATAQPAEPAEFGISGADATSIKVLSPESTEYVYPTYKVTTLADGEVAGESITVFSANGEEVWKLDNAGGGNYFSGLSNDHVFVDNGTGPDGRVLLVYDLKNKKMGYQDVYIGDPSISSDGVLTFYRPVTEKAAGKVDCPEKATWQKEGLGIGYGQMNQYSLRTGEFTSKAEFRCFPMQ